MKNGDVFTLYPIEEAENFFIIEEIVNNTSVRIKAFDIKSGEFIETNTLPSYWIQPGLILSEEQSTELKAKSI